MSRLLLSLALLAAPLSALCAPAPEMSCCGSECPANQEQVCCGQTDAAVPFKAVLPQPAVLPSLPVPAAAAAVLLAPAPAQRPQTPLLLGRSGLSPPSRA